MEKNQARILGLDLGPNSIGWALLNVDPAGECRSLEAAGVRIFQEAVDAKTRTPKNLARRTARNARRCLARYRMRRDRLLKLLTAAGLLPSHTEERQRILTDLKNYDPYALRAHGLDRELTLYEFGRALFHLNQRRGFLSNRKQKSDNEEGKIKTAISALRKEIAASNCRTLGEYLYHQTRRRNRAPYFDRYTERSMYCEEFSQLWEKQRQFKPEILSQVLRAKIYRTIFFQRPLRIQKYLVGRCSFEPLRRRIAKGRLEFQRYRYLQDVNHLQVRDPIERTWRPLSVSERAILISNLEEGDLTFDKVRHLLGLHQGEELNLEVAKSTGKLKGNRTAATLKKALGNTWTAMSIEDQLSLVTDLLTIHNEEHLHNRLSNKWKFSDQQTQAVLAVELEPGYGMLSLKAIRRILPHLENGCIYSEAVSKAGYNHSRPNCPVLSAILPLPPSLRNPVVQKALYEVRKVVNAIIRKYGRPGIIRVEMARDLKMGRAALAEYTKEQKKRAKENERIRQLLTTDFGRPTPTNADVEKYRLWKEAECLCPYTGQVISNSMLFSPEVEVEHIVPFSRSLDDSFMNKTIAMASVNRIKGNKTPYEMFEGRRDEYLNVLKRLSSMPRAKRARFEQKEAEIDDFISRQLNDTRYICREVKKYLEQLGSEIQVTKGALTAALRSAWGLNRILSPDGANSKNRVDHRHHAIDALVVALTSPSLLQSVSRLTADHINRAGRIRLTLPPPWNSFFDDAQIMISRIIVSHAASHKLSGALHEETAYGFIPGEGVYVTRKPLDGSISEAQIEAIRDPVVKALVQKRFEECGKDSKKAFGDPMRPLIHGDGRTVIRRVRIQERFSAEGVLSIKDSSGAPYKYYPLGNNHHIEIFRYPARGEYKARVVTTLEAARRARQSKTSIVNRELDDGAEFVMSLCPNDIVEYNDSRLGRNLFRVQKLSLGQRFQIALRLIHVSGTEKGWENGQVLIQSKKNLAGLKKVAVGVLGEVMPGDD